MNTKILATETTINGKQCKFDSDFRNILHIFQAFNDPDLLEEEKIIVALNLFYETDDYQSDLETAIKEMYAFMSMEQEFQEPKQQPQQKPLYSWEQDYNIIIAPINKVLGYDVRGKEYLHWWTFLSAFMEIGECTFNTYVGIRDKMNKGKKLEKYEKEILKEHRDSVIIKKKYDSVTQDIMNEIMGY